MNIYVPRLNYRFNTKLTCDLHSEEGEDLEEEDGYPAHGVGEDDEEEALGDGDLVVERHLPGRLGRFLYGVEHAGVGEHDHKC